MAIVSGARKRVVMSKSSWSSSRTRTSKFVLSPIPCGADDVVDFERDPATRLN
jgi:hypothetical protein